MSKLLKKSAYAWVVSVAVAFGMVGAVQAQTADGVTQPAKSKSKSKAKKKAAPRGNKVKVVRGSEETTSERSTRLKRECKGRVNAGACEGYTR
jgi:hypothetical protein